jgi:hypothetical protein
VTLDKIQLESTVLIISQKLKGGKYAIRGTAGLVLQGFDMNVGDVDILCDAQTALNFNAKLSEYLVEEVTFKESPKYKSYFGKFLIDGIQVEIMGDWQIFNDKKGWSRVFSASAEDVSYVKLGGLEIPVTKVEVEMEAYAWMGRWAAYQKLKRQVVTSSAKETKQPISTQQGLV